MMIVRENTEDAYVGLGGIMKKDTSNEVAICRDGLDPQGGRARHPLRLRRWRASRDKQQEASRWSTRPTRSARWTSGRAPSSEVAKEYPDIETDHAYIDAACMWMVKNPEWFDTVVTDNLFGDIITDLGAMLQGGMGIAASGNIHPGQVSMFEPIHGSAPKYKGQNKACPVATVMAVQMMLDFLGEDEAAGLVEKAVANALRKGTIPSLSAGAIGTDAAGDAIVAELRALAGKAG